MTLYSIKRFTAVIKPELHYKTNLIHSLFQLYSLTHSIEFNFKSTDCMGKSICI
jgi:hypothetical protein